MTLNVADLIREQREFRETFRFGGKEAELVGRGVTFGEFLAGGISPMILKIMMGIGMPPLTDDADETRQAREAWAKEQSEGVGAVEWIKLGRVAVQQGLLHPRAVATREEVATTTCVLGTLGCAILPEDLDTQFEAVSTWILAISGLSARRVAASTFRDPERLRPESSGDGGSSASLANGGAGSTDG